MHYLDWIIVLIPLAITIYIGSLAQKYVKGVSDFLAAGRVAGRYVICVASGEAAMGLISVIALVEMYYACGFGVSFWNRLTMPIILLLALTGYAIYRFRETKALTLGQFLEIRYNRTFRIVAAFLQAISGILNYAIFPAVGARFLIYYLDLPIFLNVFGWNFPTFGLVMLAFLSLAVVIACLGGQITIMVTDCVQGLLNYPMYLIILIFILYKFSWTTDIMPTLLDRADGESFVNPYDIENMRNFNIVYVIVGIFSNIINRLSWSGTQGYNAAALNAHEQKMGGLLGTWRSGFSTMMIVMLAMAAYVYMHNTSFRSGANNVNRQLAVKVVEDISGNKVSSAERDKMVATINTALPRYDKATQKAVSDDFASKTIDNYQKVGEKVIGDNLPASVKNYNTIHNQMLIPLTIREILPIGLTGIFCAIMVFLMLSTDTTYMHSWGSILIQDILLPIRGKAFTARQQLNLLRGAIILVALIAFAFSFFFAQLDYILMFFAITGAIWLGGAGACIIFGLYWKKGTTAGAFSALFSGAFLAVGGIICQQSWAKFIYPFLEKQEMVDSVSWFFGAISSPFNPYIVWRVTPDNFPINSQEIFFIAMLVSIFLYVTVSLLTCKKPFNMEQMLHRGIYSESGIPTKVEKFSLKSIWRGIIGITPEYTKKDKILAWSVFIYSFGYGFLLIFIIPIIWNFFNPLTGVWWAWYFFYNGIVFTLLMGVVSTIWFSYGGIKDLKMLFKRLSEKKDDSLDDGRVEGHVSASDVVHMTQVEQSQAK